MNKNKTRKNKVKENNEKELQTLRNTYGYITIPKGLSFYHARRRPYNVNKPDNVLFLTFDLSDWNNGTDLYITKFNVKKEFDLLFMVDKIHNGKIYSLLSTLLDKSEEHILNKQFENNLECYFPYMLKENLFGWFCSIEDGTGVKIALHNSNDFLEKVETVKIKSNINNNMNLYNIGFNNINNNTNNSVNINNYNKNITNNNIDKEYVITTENNPISLYINEKYKDDIEKFKIKSKKNNYDYPLQKLFKNAKIKYFKNKFTSNLKWDC